MSSRLTALLVLTALSAVPVQGQYLTRPARPWETITTTHFQFHFPTEMRPWVQPVAARMESYAEAVNAFVGNGSAGQVTVMVEDPSNLANGFAVPLLGGPTIFLWPTPPAPSPTFGAHRGWGEVLAIHEYGHIAHLTIPTRSSSEELLWRFLPVKVGPVARRSPAWVIEGYATLIEGRLTGNGRPHSAGRAAVLRQWALEGQVPRYSELNGTSRYFGGAMRYLVGSAFLEWLSQRKGDASLQHLWRRMSAREQRSFAEAFRGVYGAPPDELYGAFFTELMEKALEARRALRQAGVVEGELVQRLAWGTDEPAISRNGEHVAIVLRRPDEPARIVVWKASEEPDTARARAIQKLLERDSMDVAPFDSFPARKRAIATLHPSRGRGHESPRWFADGERLLVSRDEPVGDGSSRPDLFVWNRTSGSMRRITHGAGIRAADPAPDGRTAVGVRCAGGICDLVRIDLDSGRWTTLAAGTPFVVWHRARLSPDGRRIAASVQMEGRWAIAIVDAAGGEPEILQLPDDASRHSPAWTPDNRLVVVSERGGVPNLELIDPATPGSRTLTRVIGLVSKPDVGPDGRVWFLGLHARGNDLRRIAIAAAHQSSADPAVALDAALAPVAPPEPAPGLTFSEAPVRGPVPYRLGPRGWRMLPGLASGPDGDLVLLMLANTDPVGRWTNVLQAGYGWSGAWRGASAASALRMLPVEMETGLWSTHRDPSDQRSVPVGATDSRYSGGGVILRAQRDRAAWAWSARLGGSTGRLDGALLDDEARSLAFGEMRGRLSYNWRSSIIAPYAAVHLTEGNTAGDSWSRRIVTAGFSLGGSAPAIRIEGTHGTVTAAAVGEAGRAFEQFTVGGTTVPYFDPSYISQQVALPAGPVGYATGREFRMLRGSVRAFGFEPYAAFVGAGETIDRYRRIYGIEEEFNFTGIGFARLPGTRIRFGIGYSLDQPYKERIRPYASVTYRP